MGLHSLAHSFWINGAGLNAVLGLSSLAFAAWMRDSTMLRIYLAGYGILLVSFAVHIWQAVGIWRAADRPRTRARSRWLARVAVCSSLVAAASRLSHLETPKANAATSGRIDVRVLGKREEAELDGELGDGASAVFAQVLRQNPQIRTLHLHSRGGLLNEGLRIARIVRERQLRVVVDSLCASACTLVLLASDERLMRADAQIGFHQARFVNGAGDYSSGDDITATLEHIGASQDFIDRARNTPATEIWNPAPSQLLAEHVVTGWALPTQFVFCPDARDITAARAELESDPVLSAIADTNPAEFERLTSDYLAAPQRGATLEEVRAHVAEAKARALRDASCRPALSVIGERAELLAKSVALLSEKYPDRCAAVLDGQIDLSGVETSELPPGYADGLRRFIVESHKTPTTVERPTESDFRTLRARLSRPTLAAIDDHAFKKPVESTALCAAAREFYQAITGLTPAAMVRIVRPTDCAATVSESTEIRPR